MAIRTCKHTTTASRSESLRDGGTYFDPIQGRWVCLWCENEDAAAEESAARREENEAKEGLEIAIRRVLNAARDAAESMGLYAQDRSDVWTLNTKRALKLCYAVEEYARATKVLHAATMRRAKCV